MQNIVHVLKNWYPTNVVPESELATELANVEAQEALRLRMEEQSAEPAQIVQKAKKNGVYLKAPNGVLTNLTEHQWALVRTKSFKQEFGDWEHAAQIAKLLNSEPIIASGEEWKGKYELNRNSATKYVLGSLRRDEGKKERKYVNKDVRSMIGLSKVSSKATNRGCEMQLKVVALIPQMIENSIFLGEERNNKAKHGFACFRYYAVRLRIGATDYVARLTTCVDENGETYYDHSLTQIKKEELAGRSGLLGPQASDQRCPPSDMKDRRLLSLLQGDCSKFSNTVDKNGEPYYDHSLTEIKKEELADRSDLITNQASDRRCPPSDMKDRRLLSLLRVDFSRFSNTVDENGEPKSAQVEAFERKHKSTPLQQVRWLKQDDKVVGWFNPNTSEIVLSEEHNTSVALEAFWHATFHLATTTAPRLCNKMLAYAQDSTKTLKRAVKKRYPEFDKPRVRLEKVGAELFVIDYAGDIENSLNDGNKGEVSLKKLSELPSKKAVAALANAFARRKHLVHSH